MGVYSHSRPTNDVDDVGDDDDADDADDDAWLDRAFVRVRFVRVARPEAMFLARARAESRDRWEYSKKKRLWEQDEIVRDASSRWFRDDKLRAVRVDTAVGESVPRGHERGVLAPARRGGEAFGRGRVAHSRLSAMRERRVSLARVSRRARVQPRVLFHHVPLFAARDGSRGEKGGAGDV